MMITSLIPFNTRPNDLFEDLRRDFDTTMSRFFGRDLGTPGSESGWFHPHVDVAESEDAYRITANLPGISAEEVSLELRHGELWITGERKQEHEEKEKNWYLLE